MKTDEQLVDAVLAGSEAAFNALVLRYREKLYRFLLTRCASHADAEDAIQDTFVSAYRYLDSFNPKWRFSTWLYRIVIRNAARRHIGATDSDAEPIEYSDPLAQCITQNDRENLWLIARDILAPDAFSAMWLHYVEDMRVKDVALALNRSLPWAKVTIHRARRRLTNELRDEAALEAGAGSRSYG